jgi:hypothetical protein
MHFSADKMKISGPMFDGSYKVEFWTGEFMREKVAQLFEIAGEHNYKVQVELGEATEAPQERSKPNRYAKLSGLIKRRAKQRGKEPDEIAGELKEFYGVKSRKELTDEELREAERTLEELLGDRPPDEAYEEDGTNF